MVGESSVFTTLKEIQVLVNLDHFSKYLKYLRNFEKRTKSPKTQISLHVVKALLSPIILKQVRLFLD